MGRAGARFAEISCDLVFRTSANPQAQVRFLAAGSVQDKYARPTARLTWAARRPSLWPGSNSLAGFSSLVRRDICRPGSLCRA